MTCTANRWAHFVAAVADIDDEAKELNRKTRPVAYRLHIGDGYYISVIGGIHCIDFRKFYVPYRLSYDQVRPSKNDLSLRLDEWVHLMQVIPTVHVTFPDLANAKRCTDENSHLSQRGWLQVNILFSIWTRILDGAIFDVLNFLIIVKRRLLL